MAGSYNKWEIWLARVKFEDSNEIKERPVLITGTGQAIILALKITTHEPRDYYYGEYSVKHWQESGLREPSTIRSSKRLSLIDTDLVHKIGRLHPFDVIKVQEILSSDAVPKAV
jgi:hypothetical protein